MNRFDDEPLSPEERALADRLARLGPHDGPSPALDAKILAAAHAAVAPPQRRRGRWLGLTAIPGGLITGAGMAAALVLVIGTVWQLRPADPAPQPARSEGDAAYVSAEIIERRRQVIAPPPPAVEAPAPAKALNPPRVDRGAAVAQRKMAPAAAPAPVPEEAPAGLTSRPGTVGPDEQPLAFREVAADAPAADSFIAPAPAAAPPPPAQVQAYSDAQRSEAFELARARQQRSDEQAVSAKRAAMAAAAPVAASAPAAAPAPATVPSDAGQNTTLDRIEVTGGRITPGHLLADMPVAEDARLDPAAWLERVRARRDAGDLDDARDSLALFRKSHPRVRLPDDLRALAESAPRR